jgi:hypothetical protein
VEVGVGIGWVPLAVIVFTCAAIVVVTDTVEVTLVVSVTRLPGFVTVVVGASPPAEIGVAYIVSSAFVPHV